MQPSQIPLLSHAISSYLRYIESISNNKTDSDLPLSKSHIETLSHFRDQLDNQQDIIKAIVLSPEIIGTLMHFIDEAQTTSALEKYHRSYLLRQVHTQLEPMQKQWLTTFIINQWLTSYRTQLTSVIRSIECILESYDNTDSSLSQPSRTTFDGIESLSDSNDENIALNSSTSGLEKKSSSWWNCAFFHPRVNTLLHQHYNAGKRPQR